MFLYTLGFWVISDAGVVVSVGKLATRDHEYEGRIFWRNTEGKPVFVLLLSSNIILSLTEWTIQVVFVHYWIH